jgi:hypothetical protein
MPLVFIHGASGRVGPDYEPNRNARRAMFRRFTLPAVSQAPADVGFFDPTFGHVGSSYAWDHASLPSDKVQAMGGQDELALQLIAEVQPTFVRAEGTSVLAELARRGSLADAVDVLWGVAMDDLEDGQQDATADLAARAVAYADANHQPDWLKGVATDQIFVARLRKAISEETPAGADGGAAGRRVESLGAAELWDQLAGAAGRIGNAIGLGASFLVGRFLRRRLHIGASLTIGDVLLYMAERGSPSRPGPIVKAVLEGPEGLEAAAKLRTNDDPLIVVGHSLGGIIAYDVLSGFRPDIQVDHLVTVGSQVGVIEELKQFLVSDKAVGNRGRLKKVPKRPNIASWINVFDTNDFISFVVEPIFEGSSDFRYATGETSLTAHGSYFRRPTFYERLGVRLKGGRG